MAIYQPVELPGPMGTAFAIGCGKNIDKNWLKAFENEKLLSAGRKNMIFSCFKLILAKRVGQKWSHFRVLSTWLGSFEA